MHAIKIASASLIDTTWHHGNERIDQRRSSTRSGLDRAGLGPSMVFHVKMDLDITVASEIMATF